MKDYIVKIEGIVEHGRQLGHRLGFPTANVAIPNGFVHSLGVYVARVYVENEEYYGVASVGCRPTIEEGQQTNVECYILDFDKNIYGKHITIELLEFIRHEIKFPSVDLLKEQIEKDIAQATSIIKKTS